MSKFQVGDAVRVKAGSRTLCIAGLAAPYPSSFGKRLAVQMVSGDVVHLDNLDWCGEDCLESWNDAEEWDGSEWVAKKTEAKECFVVKRGDCFPMGEIVSSTNKALARAKSYAEAHPGTEYVVYQEKCSVKREKKTPAEQVAEAAKDEIGETFFRINGVGFFGVREFVIVDGDCIIARTKIIRLS